MRQEVIQVTKEPALIEHDELIKIAEKAEKRVEAVKKIIRAALRMTNHRDWVLFAGEPYLTCAGAEKIARTFGISWYGMQIEEEERQDEKGKYIVFTCKGRFRLKDVEIEAIGTCSTRNKFFYLSKGRVKELHEISIPDVKKAAYTNCIVNGIKRLLGLRNLTLEDLKAAGVNIDKITKVTFKEG
ncbi:MAG: hypothetical protein DRP02_12415 [Candidatus Gerdarchaeota archaeon]|nr:MAG: hypothetical protein DRP02_12415 [Candidatus Gerdarchaeota archaeon]